MSGFNNDTGAIKKNPKKQKSKLVLYHTVIISLILSLQVSTQAFAYLFEYHEALGANYNDFYPFWQIITWSFYWLKVYPEEFKFAYSAGLLCITTGIILAMAYKASENAKSKGEQFLHGSARWADKEDIEDMGLLHPEQSQNKEPGVYAGGWKDDKGLIHYLIHYGAEHVLAYAPTRSGKGVGLVIPTLLSWRASAFITDLKGELWAITSGWRKSIGQKVLKFEPATRSTVKWNPLDEIRIGTDFEVGDIQNLCTLIVDPDGKGLVDHWQKTGFALMCGLVAHALYKAKHEGTVATLPKIDSMLANPDAPISELWEEMKSYAHVDGKPHHLSSTAAQDMIDRPDDEAGSVLSTTKSYLSLYRDPVVADAISQSEFNIKDLMNHDDPVSLYIVTKPTDKNRLTPLVRVLVNMIVRLLADEMEFENGRPIQNYKYRLLGMIDEFPSLGKLDVLQESLAFVAGYGIKFYLITQDINQLKSQEKGYGRDEQVTSNCHVQIAYPPNRTETAQHLSTLTGDTTIVKEQITTSGKRTEPVHSNVSRTYQEIKRPLLTPDECMRLPAPKKNQKGKIEEAGDMVIYVAGYPAVYGKQILYFQDPVFSARAAIAEPLESDKLRTPTPFERIHLPD